jgi:DNA-binding NarL/FixJ family response regulator
VGDVAGGPGAGHPHPREHEVLLVARALRNREIAGRLHLSGATAKTPVSRVLAKLEMRDRTQLMVAAYEAGLVGGDHVAGSFELTRVVSCGG